MTVENPAMPMPVNLLVIFLTLGTGALDAIAILTLGEAFASVMTGNLIFAGLAAGTWSGGLLAHVLAALLGYIGGGAAGSFTAHKLNKSHDPRIWPPRVTVVLAGQLFLLSGVAVFWAVKGGAFSEWAELSVLFAAAAAMGIQGAAVRKIGVSVSTTYMTGALTTLIESIVTRRPFSATEKAAFVGLLFLVLGAAAGGYLAQTWLGLALIFPTITLACVVIICTVVHYRQRAPRAG